ncbi:MAG: class I SAM-dependent methyltransferase [Thermoanaerobaculia bacterium]
MLLESIHGSCVFPRRVRVLADHLAALIPENARVLDVGSGDGRVGRAIGQRRSDLDIRGIDVLPRKDPAISTEIFDGRTIPFPDASFDALLFIDVLHHTEDPTRLLREAARASRTFILIKDHRADGAFASATLRFMDRAGNARHGVALPYNYWRTRTWRETFQALGLDVDVWKPHLGLYPAPASWLFDGELHFLARLRVGREKGKR